MRVYDDGLEDGIVSTKDAVFPGEYLCTVLPESHEGDGTLPTVGEEIHCRNEDGEVYRAWVYGIEDRGRGTFLRVRTSYERVEES